MEQKLLLTHLGGLWGETGVRKKSFFRLRGSVGLQDSSPSTRSPCHVYMFFSGVRHVCHENDGSFDDADPGIKDYKH